MALNCFLFSYLVYILRFFIDFYIKQFNLFICDHFCLLYVSILSAKKSNSLSHLNVRFKPKFFCPPWRNYSFFVPNEKFRLALPCKHSISSISPQNINKITDKNMSPSKIWRRHNLCFRIYESIDYFFYLLLTSFLSIFLTHSVIMLFTITVLSRKSKPKSVDLHFPL